jgi:ribosomal protein S18 acetylase RimI-like enzyme
LANRDTRFDFAAYHAGDSDDGRDPHVFLLEVAERFVGFLVIERREYVQRFTWDQYDQPTGGPLPKGDPVWSICMVWVHQKHRRQGFATTLVSKAIEFLGTSPTKTGWYTPFSDSGRALAQRLCPESFLVAK